MVTFSDHGHTQCEDLAGLGVLPSAKPLTMFHPIGPLNDWRCRVEHRCSLQVFNREAKFVTNQAMVKRLI